ncbi:MAG TPA: hypothetical protein VNU68_19865 [Verrucomicrobiae bacterium]|nr:hypothetical protein [Verrucomicrobiae bacterium]
MNPTFGNSNSWGQRKKYTDAKVLIVLPSRNRKMHEAAGKQILSRTKNILRLSALLQLARQRRQKKFARSSMRVKRRIFLFNPTISRGMRCGVQRS